MLVGLIGDLLAIESERHDCVHPGHNMHNLSFRLGFSRKHDDDDDDDDDDDHDHDDDDHDHETVPAPTPAKTASLSFLLLWNIRTKLLPHVLSKA